MQAIPVWVISLTTEKARRQSIARHLGSLGIEYEFVDAVDGRILSDETVVRLLAPGTFLPKGHVGCSLSHVKALRCLIQSGAEFALILEDDARLSRSVVGLLSNGVATKEFDYCFLDCENFNKRGPVFFDAGSPFALGDSLTAHRLSGGPTATHAYLITRKAAERRVQHALPIRQPVDAYDLPYEIRFAAVVAPRLAWLSEHGLTSATYDRLPRYGRNPLKMLRVPAVYATRDAVLLKRFRWAMDARRRKADGRLSRGYRWVRLPAGKQVIVWKWSA